MRLFIFLIALLGMSYAVAAVTPAPVPTTDEVVLDVDTIEQDPDDFVLTQEDEEFLNSEEFPLTAGSPSTSVQKEAKADVKPIPVEKN